MDKNFGGVIWTNHALERLRSRNIKQGDAWATWNRPDQTRKGSGSASGAWVYYRTWGDRKIEVVAKKNEKGQWVIISVWADTVKNELQNKNKNASIWKILGKIFFG